MIPWLVSSLPGGCWPPLRSPVRAGRQAGCGVAFHSGLSLLLGVGELCADVRTRDTPGPYLIQEHDSHALLLGRKSRIESLWRENWPRRYKGKNTKRQMHVAAVFLIWKDWKQTQMSIKGGWLDKHCPYNRALYRRTFCLVLWSVNILHTYI